MLLSNFLSTLFYSVSYPYIYAETIKIVPHSYIGIEQILACLGTIVFCRLWNKHSDRLFEHYRMFLCAEIIADIILFADVLIRNDLGFYFLLNIIIFSVITKNLCCGGTKIKAIVNSTEKEREKYDNNTSIINSIATLSGTVIALIFDFQIELLFVFAFIGNIADNLFSLYIYKKIKERKDKIK